MQPKVRFGYAGAGSDAKAIHSFYNTSCNKVDWSNCIFSAHSPLREELRRARTDRQELSAIGCYTTMAWQEEARMIRSQRRLFEAEWGKVNGEFMSLLPKMMETQWPADRRYVRAHVSINPICPRDLDDWSFTIYYLKSVASMRETVAHETLHFLYFKKWREVFPDAERSSFESPQLVWQLSEILTPVILNDSRMKALIGRKSTAYPQFEAAAIDGRPLMRVFEGIYSWKRARGKSFADFLKASYEEAKKNESDIAFLV